MTVIDIDVLRQLEADLPAADFRLVLETFVTDMQRLRAAFAASGQAGDIAGWRRAAHGLAGAGTVVGAVDIERHARVAMALSAINATTAAPHTSAIDTAIAAALVELRNLTAPGSFGG